MPANPLLERFAAGFSRFQATWYRPECNLYAQLRRGQSPQAVIIACSDSRVDPVQILDCSPGDVFVIRNVANLVPPYEPDAHYHGVSSALEYAVCHLNVGNIVVMGHAHCGGIASLMHSAEHSRDEFLGVWMGQAKQARAEVERSLPDGTQEERLRACEMESIRLSLQNLRTFPWIRDSLNQGKLCLHGLYFDMGVGELLYLDPQTDHFISLIGSISLK